MGCFKPGSLVNIMTFCMSTETSILLLGATLTFSFWKEDQASVAVYIKVSHLTQFGKTFLIFLPPVDCVCSYLSQHMLLFQIEYMQFTNLTLFSQFHKTNVKIFYLFLTVAVRNMIIGIAFNKILLHWTVTMLGWNIQPVWTMTSSVMADKKVIFLDMTNYFFCHFLWRLIGWILSTMIVINQLF